MMFRLPRRQLTLMLAAMLATAPLLKAGEPATTTVIAVKDLAADAKAGQDLAKRITQFIDAEGWCPCRGTDLSYDAQQGCLVVRNSDSVTKQVAKFVQDMRDAKTSTVKVRCQLIAIPTGVASSAALIEMSGEPIYLTEAGVANLNTCLREKHQGQILSSPTLAVLNCQQAMIQCGTETPIVSAIKLSNANGAIAVERETEMVQVGQQISVCPAICADGKCVCLHMRAEHREIITDAATHTVNVMVPGKLAMPESLTSQKVSVVSCERLCQVPAGMTAAVYVGKRAATIWADSNCQVLDKRRVVNPDASEHLIILMTPEVTKDCCAKSCPCDGGCKDNCTGTKLPEALSKIPYVNGLYKSREVAPCCAKAQCPCDGGCSSTGCKPTCDKECADQEVRCGFEECCDKDCCDKAKPKRSLTLSFGFSFKNDKKAGCDSCATTNAKPKSDGEECTDCAGVSQEDPILTALMARYQKSVAEGKLDDAKRFARACLELDPACFSKP